MAGQMSLTYEAYQRLRADLLACRLQPGAVLRISEIAGRMSVSPGVVREALPRLTADGLVIAEPQRGFRVTPISEADLEDVTVARCEIEIQCARRALAAGDVDWETGVVSALHRLSRTPFHAHDDPIRAADEFATAHAGFHDALVAACDNRWFLKLREILYVQSERYRRLSVPLTNFDRDALQEHRDIADAALARDAVRLAALLTDHLQTTTRILLDSGVVDRNARAGPGGPTKGTKDGSARTVPPRAAK